MKKLILLLAIGLFSIASFTTIQNTDDLKLNEALAGGSCCSTSRTDSCYPDGCSSSDCAVANSWWRGDGKACTAEQNPGMAGVN